ncbi:MAG: 6-phosphogluconolactonase [Steroidobacteraceae bacterium]|nr:6-phosphogluconolactonase [Steroidobacteraceae bacterium]
MIPKVEVLETAAAVAEAAADFIAAEARSSIDARGAFSFAVSGGRTPWLMLRALASRELPWAGVHLWQVDERVAPDGDADRNLTQLRESLLSTVPLAPAHVHAMPVTTPDMGAAVREYSASLTAVAGDPPVLDLVHLGLGSDGHTASLVPGDPALEVTDADVALAGPYQGRRRMTLTFPVINRARRVLWVVTGADKSVMLRRLLDADRGIPAGRVCQDRALVLADRLAAGE